MQSKACLILFIFSLFQIIYCDADTITSTNGTVFYFAYGSNLLAKRMHIQNPTAVFYSIANLKNHRLDFNMMVDAWNGAVSTIVEDDEEDVWGALWVLDKDKIPALDKQEGVDRNWYFAKQVNVTTPDGQLIQARTYQETVTPNKMADGEVLPPERRPSSTYLEVITLGAIEMHIPAEYIGFLFSFPTNGKRATKQRREEIGAYPF